MITRACFASQSSTRHSYVSTAASLAVQLAGLA